MANAVFKASAFLLRDFGEIDHVKHIKRNIASFVKTAENRTEQVLLADLTKAYPCHNVVTKTQNLQNPDQNKTWIVNALCGRENFACGAPSFCISIALEIQSSIQACVIYDVLRDEMFWSEKNKGAFVNKQRIRVTNSDKNLIALTISESLSQDRQQNILSAPMAQTFSPSVLPLRSLGSPALDLAYVAAGRWNGCLVISQSIEDFAAGYLLVQEAGGFVTAWNKTESLTYQSSLELGYGLAASPDTHRWLRKL